MLRNVARVSVLLAAVSGLPALFNGAAHALVSFHHCEPLRRA
jgi:hypothetical protein